jgi:hypothetical protein
MRRRSPGRNRDTRSIYCGTRLRLSKGLAVGLAVAIGALVQVGAAEAGGGQVATAGQKVAGLTLTTTQVPSPVPTKLPAGKAYAPAAGKLFQGVSDKPVSKYTGTVGKHPAVYQEFLAWGQWLPTITADAKTVRARMMMMVSTAFGSKNMITPAGIADGAGDPWLIGLAQQIYASGNVTYMRLMAEMNNCNDPYAAYNCNGSSRGPAYSAAEFRQAWRRVALIMRGGLVSLIDRELAALRLPALKSSFKYLPTPKVSMLWVPMVGGSPDIAGLEPAVYYPGKRWVDWVGTDFYSRYPNWSGLSSFYAKYAPTAPFAFGEYAIWDGDNPGWTRTLFSWIASHPRARMLIYNDAPTFWLTQFPASAAVLRSALAGSKFLPYAPEWAPA